MGYEAANRSLSVAIVCKNNEHTIGAVLESVRELSSHVLAVDSGSTDRTLELLAGAGAVVVHSEWLGHVKTKQKALEHASETSRNGWAPKWVLCLDSDEPVEPELAASIERVIAADDADVAGAEVNRRIFVHGRYLRHAWQPEWRLRLVRVGKAAWMGRDPHDRLELLPGNGRTVRLEGVLRHESFRTFGEHLRAQLRHSEVGAEAMLAEGKTGSVWKLLTSPGAAFLKQLVGKQAWRDGVPGVLAAGTTAAGTLMKHIILLERSRLGSGEPRGERRHG